MLVALGPYPIAMVGLDTAGVTNSQPPKVTLIALAFFQTGLLLALEGPARRMLAREQNWGDDGRHQQPDHDPLAPHREGGRNGGSLALDAWGLRVPVNTTTWWLTRQVWISVLIVATMPFLVVFGRYERPNPDNRPAPPAWRPLLAVITTVAGLGLLAHFGIADREGLSVDTALRRRRRRRHWRGTPVAAAHRYQPLTGKAISQAGSLMPTASQSAK